MKKTLEGTYVYKAGKMLGLYTEKAKDTEATYLLTEPDKGHVIGLNAAKEGKTAKITLLWQDSSKDRRGQEALTFMLNRLKKEGVEKAEITNPKEIREEAASAGFVKKGQIMEITGLQEKKLRIERKNEKTIARYAREGIAYELKETKDKRRLTPLHLGWMNIVKIEDARNGLAVAVVEWCEDIRARQQKDASKNIPGRAAAELGKGKDAGWIDAVKTSLESARMAKTALLYALWQMKQQGLQRALLTLGPEEGKKEKAERLYLSAGFRPWPDEDTWEIDLPKTQIQRIYLK